MSVYGKAIANAIEAAMQIAIAMPAAYRFAMSW
jgi:hypothetical protein